MGTTIKDVAALAKVSRATASRVLGGYGYVSREVRERVLEAARTLHYRPHAIAQSMVTGRTKTIGVVVGDIENPFFARAARGVSDAITPEGYNLIVCTTNENASEERRAVEGLCDKRVDGLIVAPASTSDFAHLADLVRQKVPFVLIDRVLELNGLDMVAVHNEEGAWEAVRHLIQRGHTRIGFLSDSFDISPNVERLEGYQRALTEAGLEYDAKLVRMASFTVESGYREAVSLLSSPGRPTAVFAANNFMTVGILRAAKDMHLAVPEQLALVGFDDMEWLELTTPTITAVAQPVYELGQVAAQRLLRRIGGDANRPEMVRLPTRLMVRASSAART